MMSECRRRRKSEVCWRGGDKDGWLVGGDTDGWVVVSRDQDPQTSFDSGLL
jgi:hypothetical protein